MDGWKKTNKAQCLQKQMWHRESGGVTASRACRVLIWSRLTATFTSGGAAGKDTKREPQAPVQSNAHEAGVNAAKRMSGDR
eukprot:6186482-Pleurochrysis_carterae.AAC.1